MFAPLPIGLALLAAGLAVLPLLRRQAAARRTTASQGVTPARTESYFAQAYGIDGDVFELTVSADSPLVGMSIGEAEAHARRAAVPGPEDRQRVAAGAAGRRRCIWVGSVLGVMGKREAVADLRAEQLAAAVVAPAQLRRPVQSQPRRHFRSGDPADLALHRHDRRPNCSCASASASACWRSTATRRCLREDVRKLPLRAGDMLVFHSIWTDLAQAGEQSRLRRGHRLSEGRAAPAQVARWRWPSSRRRCCWR